METKYSQGNCDNLCGVYASINAALLSTEGVTKFSRKQVRNWFQLIIADLAKRRKLLEVHKVGSSVELVEGYLDTIREQLANNIELTYYKPFTFKTRTTTALKKLSAISQQANKAVIIGIEGFYDHWSLVSKITSDRVFLNDSDGLKYLNIKSIPKRYDLTVEDTIVVSAKEV